MKTAIAVGLLVVCIARAQEVEISGPLTNQVRLDWQAVPSKTYDVQTTPLLGGSWTSATPTGIVASNVLGNYAAAITSGVQFFRVTKQDTDAPSIESLVPADASVAIQTNAAIYVTIADETGIDTNSIVLSIGSRLNMTLASPGLTISNGLLSFTPAASLGADGAIITNRLSVSDTLGHTLTNYTWTFQLARAPVATNAFLPLIAPPSSQTTKSGLRRTIPGVRPLSGPTDLIIVSVTSNTVIFSYDGTAPTVTSGTILVSFDAANRFYRKVTSNSTDTITQRITSWTTDIPLTDLLDEGSFSSLDLTPATLSSGPAQLANISLNLLHVEFGDDLSGTVLYEDGGLKLHLPTADWSFTGDIDVYADITTRQLRSFDAVANGELVLHLSPEVLFDQATSGADEIPLVQPITKVFGGLVGGVPVWVEVIMELNGGYEYSASVHGDAHATLSASSELTFSVSYRNGQWSRTSDKSVAWTAEPITWQINGEANAKFYVQPKLTVLAYSLAGLWADVVPYAEFDGTYQANPLQYELGLYFGLSSTLGITSRIPGIPEPDWSLFDQRWPLWTDVFPATAGMPAFATAFPNKSVGEGASVSLLGFASGSPAPSYRWFFNGTRIVGASSPEYRIENARMGHTGTFAVEAFNSSGSIITSCTVSVYTFQSVTGLVAYYPLDGNANDLSGKGNHGVVYGASLDSDRFGHSGKAYRFDGTDDYIDLANPVGNNPAYVSQCAWVKLLSREPGFQRDTIISKRHADDGSDWPTLAIGSGDYEGKPMIVVDEKNYINQIPAPNPQPLNQWMFLCAIRRGYVYEIYVNGLLANSATDSRTMNGSSYNMHLMHQGAWNKFANGVVDDVRIYDRALSAAEVQSLYNQTRP